MRARSTLGVTLAAAALVACGKDPVAPGPDTGPLTAYIDGDLFIADSARVTRSGVAASHIEVEAWGPGSRSITFELNDLGPANYLVGPGNPVSASVTIGTSTWIAEAGSGSGAITMTASLPTRLEGSFRLTVVGGGSPSSLDVEQGLFVIDYF